MSDRLTEIRKKCDELALQLANPDVVKDIEKFKTLSQEYSEFNEIVEQDNKIQRLQKELTGAKELFQSESDQELRELAECEITQLNESLDREKKTLKKLLHPPDPYDNKNTILEIRAGTGGAEAGLFAADLFRMYTRYAENQNWKVEIMSQSTGELEGFKEIIALISGKHVYGQLKFESGVHRVQRVPVTETSGRIHTSAVTVAVLPEADDVEIDIAPQDLKIDVYRSSGPGGQSVNTTDSAVRITHVPTGLIVTCQDEKSQHKNKAKAMKILKSRLLDKAKQEHDEKIAAERRQMVSTGDRSAKIRTYNFPQNRVSDHRIQLTLHKLDRVLEGDLSEIINALEAHELNENLKSSPHLSDS